MIKFIYAEESKFYIVGEICVRKILYETEEIYDTGQPINLMLQNHYFDNTVYAIECNPDKEHRYFIPGDLTSSVASIVSEELFRHHWKEYRLKQKMKDIFNE